MKTVLSYVILILFVCLIFNKLQNDWYYYDWYYLIYGIVILYCFINIQEEIDQQNK